MQVKSVLIVSYLDKNMSDNYVLPQQITFCNTKVIYHILKRISQEIKEKLKEIDPLSDDEISKISEDKEIMFFEQSTISALKLTFPNTVFDKTYYIDNDMINIMILQEN